MYVYSTKGPTGRELIKEAFSTSDVRKSWAKGCSLIGVLSGLNSEL